jgi:hypothetical protein
MNVSVRGIKNFVKRHQRGILFIGGTILGVTVTTIICKSKKGEIIEVLPEWAKKWKDHCDIEMLLYDSGLPIFANPEQTIIYRDAIVESAIPEMVECGYQIIDRV